MKVFLFLHRGALGDFALTWPSLAALRRHYPNHFFLGIGRPDYLELACTLGLADAGIHCESAALRPFYDGEALPNLPGELDAALLWTQRDPGLEALLEERCAGPVHFHPAFPGGSGHVLDHHMDCLPFFSAHPVPDMVPHFSLGLRRGNAVLIHPGSGSPAKNHSPGFYASLALAVRDGGCSDVRILLGPVETALKECYEGLFPVEEPASALKLARLLESAALFIGNDSGVSHLSALLGTPTVALYRNTDPSRWGIRGKAAVSLTAPEEGTALEGVLAALPRLRDIF